MKRLENFGEVLALVDEIWDVCEGRDVPTVLTALLMAHERMAEAHYTPSQLDKVKKSAARIILMEKSIQ